MPSGPPEIAGLLVMAEALQRLDRPAQQLQALQAVVQRAPDNPRYRQMLAEARRAAGLLVAGINTEPEAEPARACLRFTVPLAKRTDWQPQDWVRAEPPVPGLAVLREGEQLCVAGLPHGQSTRLVLRAGLPGEDGLRLNKDAVLRVAMPDRAARIVFDASRFLLPRGQAQQVGLATVNLSALSLRVVRVTERNLVPFGRNAWTVGEAISGWAAEELPESWGRTVWEGRVELPALQANRVQRSTLPLPEVLKAAGPGLYALIARPARRHARARAAALPVIVTDLGLTAWRGPQGLAVQARAFGAGRPLAGVQVRLLATSNDILAEAVTEADGTARFAAPLLRGQGPMAPRALHATLGDDLVALDLDAAAFDLSDRGATGAPHPGPLDAFAWLDRGIYRPGETVQAAVLLRDGGGAPPRHPGPAAGAAAEWQRLRRAGPGAAAGCRGALAHPAARRRPGRGLDAGGAGRPRRAADRPGRVPRRRLRAGTAGGHRRPGTGPLVPGQPLVVPIAARFLYGAPGAGLTGSAELRLQAQRAPFAQHKDFVFGLVDEEFAPDLIPFEIEPLDAKGQGSLTLGLPRAPDTTRPLTAELSIAIDEPGGRAVPHHAHPAGAGRPSPDRGEAAVRRPGGGCRGGGGLRGHRRLEGDANPVAARLRARLVRERPDWRIVTRAGQARYETVWRDEAVDSADLAVTAAGPARFARTLPFGRYRLEVAEPGGMAVTSVRFRAGWAGGETAEVPDKVDVAADRRAYAPGEVARLRITPPFSGPASLAVLTDRLVSDPRDRGRRGRHRGRDAGRCRLGPGRRCRRHRLPPGEARQGIPAGRLGLAWLQVDPGSRRIEVAIGTPERVRPSPQAGGAAAAHRGRGGGDADPGRGR